MKRRTKILITAGILGIIGMVRWQWDSIRHAVFLHQLPSVTTALPSCDRVEVYRLNGLVSMQKEAQSAVAGEVFPVKPYSDASPIVGHQTLLGADAEAIAALWRQQHFDPHFKALCHHPAYGLRFYSKDDLLFESSVCFNCANFSVEYLYVYSGFWGFNAGGSKGRELWQKLERIVPDPASK